MINLKSFFASLCIHLLFCFLFLIIFQFNVKSSTKYIEIDLSLGSLSGSALNNQKGSHIKAKITKKLAKKKKISKKIAKKVYKLPEKKENIKKGMVLEEKSVQEKSVIQEKNLPSENVNDKGIENKDIAMIKNVMEGLGKTEGRSREEGSGEGEGKGEGKGSALDIEKKFLAEKLFIISRLVQNNITYPYIARKMGWEGKVVLTFVLTKKGEIRFLQIEKSSGYKILDKNAIDTIKRVSKYFPLPPIDVKIRLPISYKLE